MSATSGYVAEANDHDKAAYEIELKKGLIPSSI
jgi:hypothetical protein